jgi:hypothetical protein
MTAPSQVAYDDVLRVWREADSIPQIEHAWLFHGSYHQLTGAFCSPTPPKIMLAI